MSAAMTPQERIAGVQELVAKVKAAQAATAAAGGASLQPAPAAAPAAAAAPAEAPPAPSADEHPSLAYIMTYMINTTYELDTRTNAGINAYTKAEEEYLDEFKKTKLDPLKARIKNFGKEKEPSAAAAAEPTMEGGAMDPAIQARFAEIDKEIEEIKRQLGLLMKEKGSFALTAVEKLKVELAQLEEEYDNLKNGMYLDIFGDKYYTGNRYPEGSKVPYMGVKSLNAFFRDYGLNTRAVDGKQWSRDYVDAVLKAFNKYFSKKAAQENGTPYEIVAKVPEEELAKDRGLLCRHLRERQRTLRIDMSAEIIPATATNAAVLAGLYHFYASVWEKLSKFLAESALCTGVAVAPVTAADAPATQPQELAALGAASRTAAAAVKRYTSPAIKGVKELKGATPKPSGFFGKLGAAFRKGAAKTEKGVNKFAVPEIPKDIAGFDMGRLTVPGFGADAGNKFAVPEIPAALTGFDMSGLTVPTLGADAGNTFAVPEIPGALAGFDMSRLIVPTLSTEAAVKAGVITPPTTSQFINYLFNYKLSVPTAAHYINYLFNTVGVGAGVGAAAAPAQPALPLQQPLVDAAAATSPTSGAAVIEQPVVPTTPSAAAQQSTAPISGADTPPTPRAAVTEQPVVPTTPSAAAAAAAAQQSTAPISGPPTLDDNSIIPSPDSAAAAPAPAAAATAPLAATTLPLAPAPAPAPAAAAPAPAPAPAAAAPEEDIANIAKALDICENYKKVTIAEDGYCLYRAILEGMAYNHITDSQYSAEDLSGILAQRVNNTAIVQLLRNLSIKLGSDRPAGLENKITEKPFTLAEFAGRQEAFNVAKGVPNPGALTEGATYTIEAYRNHAFRYGYREIDGQMRAIKLLDAANGSAGNPASEISGGTKPLLWGDSEIVGPLFVNMPGNEHIQLTVVQDCGKPSINLTEYKGAGPIEKEIVIEFVDYSHFNLRVPPASAAPVPAASEGVVVATPAGTGAAAAAAGAGGPQAFIEGVIEPTTLEQQPSPSDKEMGAKPEPTPAEIYMEEIARPTAKQQAAISARQLNLNSSSNKKHPVPQAAASGTARKSMRLAPTASLPRGDIPENASAAAAKPEQTSKPAKIPESNPFQSVNPPPSLHHLTRKNGRVLGQHTIPILKKQLELTSNEKNALREALADGEESAGNSLGALVGNFTRKRGSPNPQRVPVVKKNANIPWPGKAWPGKGGKRTLRNRQKPAKRTLRNRTPRKRRTLK